MAYVLYRDNRRTHLKDDSITITWLDGNKVPQAAGGYSATFDFKAQRILLTITNLSDRPVEVHRITISGVPILANETQIVSVGTATVRIFTRYPSTRISRISITRYGLPVWSTRCTARLGQHVP
jgi:hypothetical protein